jgi:deoxyribodipyrimidine photo-lyase
MSGLNEVSFDQSRVLLYEKAITGQTGIDCFDSWATELMEHSYLHNHARLWFASIWIFTLKLPWELGANFFMKYLLDGDPASNTLSWRWVSGLHTKGKNYLATSSNIDKFTLGRFRIEAHLNEVANPLTELTEHPIQSLPRLENLPSDDFLLLVTEEDCNSVDLTGQFPVAALGLILPEKSEVFERSDAVFNFSHGAVTDGVERISSTGEVLICEEWAEPIIELARSKKVKNIVTAYTPIGPVNTKLQGIKPLLKNAGIELSFLRQKYDQTFWPHATKGFFAFKKSTNKLVQELAPYAP